MAKKDLFLISYLRSMYTRQPLRTTSCSGPMLLARVVRNVCPNRVGAQAEEPVGFRVNHRIGEPLDRYFINIFLFSVHITISQFTNYSRPCHDWRPSPPPQLFYAPVDGM